MKESMILNCTEKFLAGASCEDGTERVTLLEFRFPWNDYHFMNTRFFVLRHRLMDWDDACWDRMFNDLRTAMAALGKEANRKFRYRDGRIENVYGKVEYCDDWGYYRDELRELSGLHDDEPRYPSSTAGDYGPNNPWDAPGMSTRDFI